MWWGRQVEFEVTKGANILYKITVISLLCEKDGDTSQERKLKFSFFILTRSWKPMGGT